MYADGYVCPHVTSTANERNFRAQPPLPHVAAGAGSEALSEQHRRPPSRVHISWEFDNRNRLRGAAAPAVPSRERNTNSSNNTSHNRHSNTSSSCVEQASTSASRMKDTEQRQEQAVTEGAPEDAGAATIEKCDIGDGSPPSGGSAAGGRSGAGATVHEARGRSLGVEGRGGGAGDDIGSMSHASNSGGAVVDVGIGRESAAEPFGSAPPAGAAATAASSSAPAKVPTTPPGLQWSRNEGDGDGGKRVTEESGRFVRSVRTAESVGDAHGDAAATGLEGLVRSEHDYDPETGDLATGTNDVGDTDRVDTAPLSSRGLRQEHKGEDDDSSAGAREDNSETSSRNCSPVRSVREGQEEIVRSSSVGEDQRAPRQTVQGASQAPSGCSGEQDDNEEDGDRVSERKVEGNPAVADGGEKHSSSVWSNSSSNGSSNSTGRNSSPKTSSRGSPKTVGEAKSVSETPATTSGGYDWQEKTTASTPGKGADSRGPHLDNGKAEDGGNFVQPKVSNQDARTTSQGRGIGDEDGSDDDSRGSFGSTASSAGVVNPISKLTQHEPGVTQSGVISDAEGRRSRGYRETGEGEGEARIIGDSRTVGNEESASAAEEDDYGSDFASQVPPAFDMNTW